MEKLRTVSLCLIAKDEEKVIGRCLKSLKPLVDEIILVDTGSQDKTVDIARQWGAKIFYFPWNQNFSDARNTGIKEAKMDWILIVDADEYLREGDEDKLVAAFNDFTEDGYLVKTLNFSKENSQDYIINLNHRIFKNNKKAHFVGAIHEQVTPIDHKDPQKPPKILDIGFYHTGYLETARQEKDKQGRNLQILERLVTESPNHQFYLFSLANEYAKTDLDKALKLYDRAYGQGDFLSGYIPKLILYRIMALQGLGRYQEALAAVSEGLGIFPDLTDLYYFQGNIHRKQNHPKKAIQSYETALRMGKPKRDFLQFQDSSYRFGPLFNLAQIYEETGYFELAAQNYEHCLKVDPSKYQLTQNIFRCLVQLDLTEGALLQRIRKNFNEKDPLHQQFLLALCQKNQALGCGAILRRQWSHIELPATNFSVLEVGQGGYLLDQKADLLTWENTSPTGYRNIHHRNFSPKEIYEYAFIPDFYYRMGEGDFKKLLASLLPIVRDGVYFLGEDFEGGEGYKVAITPLKSNKLIKVYRYEKCSL